MGFFDTKEPTSIYSITLPDYHFFSKENQVGEEIRRTTDEKSGDKTEISLLYEGIVAEELETLIEEYHQKYQENRGYGFYNVMFPLQSSYLDSLQLGLKAFILYFKEKPTIITNYNNIYTVRVDFVGKKAELDYPDKVDVILQNSIIISGKSSTEFLGWKQISGNEVYFQPPTGSTVEVISSGGFFTTAGGGRIIIQVYYIDNPLVYKNIEINPAPKEENIGSHISTFLYNEPVPIQYKIPEPIFFNPHLYTYNIKVKKRDITHFGFSWTPPSDLNNFSHYKIETYDGLNWNFYTQLETNRHPSNFPVRTTFRIVNVYKFGNQYLEYPSKYFYIEPNYHLVDYTLLKEEIQNIKTKLNYVETPFIVEQIRGNYQEIVNTNIKTNLHYIEDFWDLKTIYTDVPSENIQTKIKTNLSYILTDVPLGGIIIG